MIVVAILTYAVFIEGVTVPAKLFLLAAFFDFGLAEIIFD